MKIARLILCLLAALPVAANLPAADPPPDAFTEMLSSLGLDEADLGFRPQGYWTRYPDPQDVPYKLPAFDGLMAEPHRIYDFTRVMALAVEDYLHPDYLAAHSNALLKVAYYTGVRNVTAQFRDYSASLWAEVDQEEPLLAAIRQIYAETGRTWRYHAMGQAADFPLIERDLREAIRPLHPEMQKAVAGTVLHLLSAWRFRQTAMRNVDWEDAVTCWRLRHLGETQFDGLEYHPQLDDAARALDRNSLIYAGYKLLESSEQLADTLAVLRAAKGVDWGTQKLNVETPIGRIVIGGPGDDRHRYSDLLLLVDLGGDDTYEGAVGSTPSLDIPISLAVDLEGNDNYVNEDEYLPSQGAAIFGAGMLLDLAGNDAYRSTRLGQGAAMLGVGILADMAGDDEYELWTDGQGAAYFGVGVAIDNSGDDRYRLWGDGQGYGGVGGVGALVNRTGRDLYYCEPLAGKVFRPDFHAKEGKFNYSYAQGCGIGRRGDITDGHSWAGGMGTLIDLAGDDVYEAAQWAQGCGYWYGMGFLWDGGGDDRYAATGWSMGAGAHFCLGALIDEGGDDRHVIWEEQSQGLGFGHDYTVALCLNRGGDDEYRVNGDGLGFAINMSQVFFFDTEGNDRYEMGSTGRGFGWNNFEQYNPPIIGAFPILYSDQICLFGDLAGRDQYGTVEFASNRAGTSRMQDGARIFTPEPAVRDTLANPRYYGLGVDFPDWQGPPVEYFRDKMARRFKEFK
ncbi:MAG: hypothetical protein C4524_00655 [Candidatus Zixiibacteriota bacterium]|nr:MAG: hypothetical protein C4524_00655 [candidate division Zixibacteria bacterium]